MIRVNLIKPLLPGHMTRGTGEYFINLSKHLSLIREVDLEVCEYGDKFKRWADVYHYAFFDPFFLSLPLLQNSGKTVVTVHDLIPLRFLDKFNPGIRGSLKWQVQRLSLKSKPFIITDSLSSKKDIESFTKVGGAKISVIPLAAADVFYKKVTVGKLREVTRKYDLPLRFILYVGDVNYNKNLVGLIKAFKIVGQKIKDLSFVIVSRAFQNRGVDEVKRINELINELNLKDKLRIISNADSKDLPAIYNKALLYVQLSLAEGFGLPVLEAMAQGVPVLVSNASSLKEVAGKAGMLVDPFDLEDVSEKIIKIIKSYRLRKKMSEKSLARAKEYSWLKTARKTYDVYQKVFGS